MCAFHVLLSYPCVSYIARFSPLSLYLSARPQSAKGHCHDTHLNLLVTVLFFFFLVPGRGMIGRGRGGFGGRGRGRGRGRSALTRPVLTKEQLDNQLDAYMSKTKGHLDAELDAYMAQTDPETND